MEKEIYQDYHDLIISLIKEHKKFSGLESILDDIVEDVFKHASVVLGTVNNDDVVLSYLKKVISTSIITVPKQLNLEGTSRKNRVSLDLSSKRDDNFEEELQELAITKEDVSLNEDVIISEFECEDQDEEVQEITEIDECATEELVKGEQDDEASDLLELSVESVEGTEQEEFVENIVEQDDTNNTDLDKYSQEILSEEASTCGDEVKDVNIDLVDKMINGLPKDSESAINKENLELEINLPEEELDMLSEVEEADIVDDEQIIDSQPQIEELIIEEIVEDNEHAVDSALVDEDTMQLSEEDSFVELALEESEEVFESEDLEEDLVNNIEDDSQVVILEESEPELELGSEDISEYTEESTLLEEDDSDFVLEESSELTEEFVDFVGNVQDEIQLEAKEDTDVVELDSESAEEPIELQETDVEDFEVTTSTTLKNPLEVLYERFSYTPSNLENDFYTKEDILEELTLINSKHPEYKPLDVYKLKYTENQSVEFIAKNLNIEISVVLEVLNEIVGIIKD